MAGPFRGFSTTPSLTAHRRRVPRALVSAILFEQRGNVAVATVLLVVGLLAAAIGVISYRVAPGYDGATSGHVVSCRVETRLVKDKPKSFGIIEYQYVVDGTPRSGTDETPYGAFCPRPGERFDVEYVPEDPQRSRPSDEAGPYVGGELAAVVVIAIAAGLALLGLVLAVSPLRRRARMLRVLRTGALVRARLVAAGDKTSDDIWGTEAQELQFALPPDLQVVEPVRVTTTRPAHVMDDPTERLLLEPPHWRYAVAVDVLPGTVEIDDEQVRCVGGPTLAAALRVPVVVTAAALALGVALLTSV